MREVNYNIAVVRRLLLAAFTPDDLVRFCKDRDEFRHFTEYMPTPLSRVSAVDVVIERCETELLTLQLLREVKQHNPAQYERFEPKLFSPSKRGESRADIRTLADGPKELTSSPPDSLTHQHPTSVSTAQAALPQDTSGLSVMDWFRQLARKIENIALSWLPAAEPAHEQEKWVLGRGPIHQLALLGDRQAFAGTATGTILLDLHSQQVVLEVDFVPERVAVSSDCALLALADRGQVALFDIGRQRMHGSRLTFKGKLTSMAFTPQESHLALLFSDEKVELRDVLDWSLIRTFESTPMSRKPFLERVLSGVPYKGVKIAFSSDRRWLVSVQHARVALFQSRDARLIRCLGADSRELSCLAFSPDCRTVASGDLAGHVRVHQVANGQIEHSFPSDWLESLSVTALAFSPDGTLLAAAMKDRAVKRKRQRIESINGPTVKRKRQGRRPRNNFIQLWNLSTGKPWKAIPCHTGFICGIGFTDSGSVLISAGSEGTVCITRLVQTEPG